MPRFVRIACLIAAALSAAGPAAAGLLTLTVVEGVVGLDGTTLLDDPLGQESLSGSTLGTLGSPLLADPATGTLFGLTVRITNTSDRDVLFGDALPGVSVLTSVFGIPGYASRTNVGAGGAARSSGEGAEGTVSRFALDMSGPLDAASSPADGPNGGGGGAATGVADCWISVTGASGAELAAYLAGVTLAPGESVDIPDFIRIAAFGRSSDEAKIAFGFDLPTFSSGGVSVTCGAWTGAFAGPGPDGGAGGMGGDLDGGGGAGGGGASVPEPAGPAVWIAGLGALAACGRLGARSRRERREEGAGEHR